MLPALPADDAMVIRTDRLDLLPSSVDDAADLFPLLKDPSLGRYTGEAPPVDVHAVRARFESWASRRSPDGSELWLNWILRRRADGSAVGTVQATVGDGDAAIAWTVGTAFQGRGFATEAGGALIDWLRATLNVSVIVGSIHPENVASQTAAQRVGLAPTGRTHDGEVLWELIPPATPGHPRS